MKVQKYSKSFSYQRGIRALPGWSQGEAYSHFISDFHKTFVRVRFASYSIWYHVDVITKMPTQVELKTKFANAKWLALVSKLLSRLKACLGNNRFYRINNQDLQFNTSSDPRECPVINATGGHPSEDWSCRLFVNKALSRSTLRALQVRWVCVIFGVGWKIAKKASKCVLTCKVM